MAEDQVKDKATDAVGTARQVTLEDQASIAEWCGGSAIIRTDDPGQFPEGRPVVEVFTGQGVKTADLGNWIVSFDTVFGSSFFVLSDEDFQNRYEPVPESQEG